MKTELNALDSPQVDVLVMVPISPTAERDMRIMRQSVEMWEAGIDYMADEMDLGWLADGMDFHVFVQYIDPTGTSDEFSTYPIVDPEIVVIATNPVGGAGIGIDPIDTLHEIGLIEEDAVPCHGIQNPFDFEAWENLPGFDDHHEMRTGTYVEDCGGAGGNLCFAINGAIDPAPDVTDIFSLFDLVSHEFGHCLTAGHVGDGTDGPWGPVPTNDIMAYSADPPGLNKCVSSLDVEAIAITMSGYLDVNDDGAVDGDDKLGANDPGDGSILDPNFQVQNPRDHVYASSTGSPADCPQPDLGVIPGPRTQWTPTPVNITEPVLTVTSPQDGDASADGEFHVTGTVEHQRITRDPTTTTGAFDDADDDASTPLTEILSVDVEATGTHVDATMALADIWPDTTVMSGTSYTIEIDGRRFNSLVRYADDANPMTFDEGASGYLPAGSSSWDLEAKTVSFHIPRDTLDSAGITSPYAIRFAANIGGVVATVDDVAPEGTDVIAIAGPVAGASLRDGTPPAVSGREAITFEHEGGNTFTPDDSTQGIPAILVEVGQRHHFQLTLDQPSDVSLTLAWSGPTGQSDLDLRVTGDASSGSDGASALNPEHVELEAAEGFLAIEVDPFLVTDPEVTYTLTGTVTPVGVGDSDGDGVTDSDDDCPDTPGSVDGCPDGDGDGVADIDDGCPDVAGSSDNGCPATEHVHVYVDGTLTATQDVDTRFGPAAFDLLVDVPRGRHTLRIEWEDEGAIIASHSVDVAGSLPRDTDGDTIPDWRDNCDDTPNRSQADMDGDGQGDACDSDIDGDGWTNQAERRRGTDPRDPTSHPPTRRTTTV
jgi:hypothetical protein